MKQPKNEGIIKEIFNGLYRIICFLFRKENVRDFIVIIVVASFVSMETNNVILQQKTLSPTFINLLMLSVGFYFTTKKNKGE